MRTFIIERIGKNWSDIEAFEGTVIDVPTGLDESGIPNTGLTPEMEQNFEKLLNLDKGMLNKRSPYWNTYTVKIPAGKTILKESIPEQALAIAVLSVNKLVATRMDDINTAVHRFYMYSPETKAKDNASVKQARFTAIAKFASLSEVERKNVLSLLKPSLDYSTTDPNIIYDQLSVLVESQPKSFIEALDTVNKPEAKNAILIQECMSKGIVDINESGMIYYGEKLLGHTISEAAQKLLTKEYQGLRLELVKANTVKKADAEGQKGVPELDEVQEGKK